MVLELSSGSDKTLKASKNLGFSLLLNNFFFYSSEVPAETNALVHFGVITSLKLLCWKGFTVQIFRT